MFDEPAAAPTSLHVNSQSRPPSFRGILGWTWPEPSSSEVKMSADVVSKLRAGEARRSASCGSPDWKSGSPASFSIAVFTICLIICTSLHCAAAQQYTPVSAKHMPRYLQSTCHGKCPSKRQETPMDRGLGVHCCFSEEQSGAHKDTSAALQRDTRPRRSMPPMLCVHSLRKRIPGILPEADTRLEFMRPAEYEPLEKATFSPMTP
jgi:hypothetical protein